MPLKGKDAGGTTTRIPLAVDSVYHFAGSALAPVATPTAVIVLKASATKTVRLYRVKVTGAATAAGTMPVFVTKRTTDGTPGSAELTAITPCKDATATAANTASVSTVGTANYTTLGTAAGVAAAGRVQMTALATGLAAVPFLWEPKKPIALTAGSTEEITVELGGAALPSGGVIDWELVTEESDD